MNKDSLRKRLGLPELPKPGCYFEWTRTMPGQDPGFVRAIFGSLAAGEFRFECGGAQGVVGLDKGGQMLAAMEDRDRLDTFFEEVRGMILDEQEKEL